jgi:hypothetical protein
MTTQADNGRSPLGKSLDGQGAPPRRQATVQDPLPDGWRAFCSQPDRRGRVTGQWYATAPWQVLDPSSPRPSRLDQTVTAPSWQELHEAVEEQIRLYAQLRGEE